MFALTAQCSSKPSQATAHMGPLRQAIFYFFCIEQGSMQSCCATTENTGWSVSAGWWLQRLSLSLYHSLSPRALCENPFHVSTATLLIVHSQFTGKSINVSTITVTGT